MKHDLEPDEAKRVAEQAFRCYQQKYASFQPQLRWVSDDRADASFSAKGMQLRGVVALVPHAIHVDLDVPLMLRPFRKAAIGIMERELAHWTQKAKAGEI